MALGHTEFAIRNRGERNRTALQKRGPISLVCNVALNNVGSSFAQRTKQSVETVREELRANLIPGAIPVPSGICALIRAQNAGCAFMQGT